MTQSVTQSVTQSTRPEWFEWRGRDVAWTVRGSGPAVVMCHGTPWSSWLWEPFADGLAKDFSVYLWDMPGYGRSSKHPRHEVDLGVQGELFGDLLRYWRLREPHVVAHDYGGAVSLRALLLHGASYASLCLVDVVALRPWGSNFFRLVKGSSEVFACLPAPLHRSLVEAYVEGASQRGLRRDDLARLVEPWTSDGSGQAAFYRQMAQADEAFTEVLEPLLGSITVPVHIVWGEDDTWIPADRAERLHDAIPASSWTVIAGAGHLVQLDQPVPLACELAGWLRRVCGPGH